MKLFCQIITFCFVFGVVQAKPLRIAIVQEWGTFNRIKNDLASNDAIAPMILRQIVGRAADGSVVPEIAESVPKLKDKKAIWKIRSNAKWGDGTQITCADWELGWQAGLNPNVSVGSRNVFEKISKINWDKNSPKICEVQYKSNDWTYDRDLPPLLPAHLEKTIYEKSKSESLAYDRNSLYVSSPATAGLYSGPYVVSEFKLGSHIILKRNDHFFGTKPAIESIVFTHVSDTSALRAQLLSKQIDAISAVGFPPDSAINYDEEFSKEGLAYTVRFQNSPIFQGLFMNLENPILQDIRVREAISRAIDKTQITKNFFKNKLAPAEGILPPQHPAYKKITPLFSKQKAKQILEGAGWKKNSQGVLEKDGKALSLVYKTSAGIKVLENIQVYICDQLKDVGIQCLIKNEPPRTLLSETVSHGDFDLIMFGQEIPPDTSLNSFFASTEIPTAKNNWTGGNVIRAHYPKLDVLLKKFDDEHIPMKRSKLASQIEEFLRNEFAMIPLYHRREAMVFPKSLSGVKDSFGGTSFETPETWIIK